MARSRRPLLVAALVAAPVSLLAAGATAVAVESLRDDGPPVEADLRLSPGDASAVVEGDPTGDMAPHDAFPLLDGGEASLIDYTGTPVVVNFFASWCAPCEDEMPALDALASDLRGRVEVVGLGMDVTLEDARAFAERVGVGYDLGHDEGGELATRLGVVNLPTTVFLSADHEVVDVHAGVLTGAELRERASALLEGA